MKLRITNIACAAGIALAAVLAPVGIAAAGALDHPASPIVSALPDGGTRVECPPYGALVDTPDGLTCLPD